MAETPNRWEGVYQSKEEAETSWFEDRPRVSLDLIAETGAGKDAAIVDVGAGSSRLVDCLLDQGFRRITVLDLSETALRTARARLSTDAPVEWVEANVLHWQPSDRFDVWHDRAAFHFLTEAADRSAYKRTLLDGTQPGSHVILATFAPDGPATCSGLPVQRYDAAALADQLGAEFERTDDWRQTHVTPWGSEQRFQWCLFTRR